MFYTHVACRSGVKYHTVRRILRGYSGGKMVNLLRIAEALGMNLVAQFDGGKPYVIEVSDPQE